MKKFPWLFDSILGMMMLKMSTLYITNICWYCLQNTRLYFVETERGSVLFCCWTHFHDISFFTLNEELGQAHSCWSFLQRTHKFQSYLCHGIHEQTIRRLDVPRTLKALKPKQECDNASPHVSVKVENNIVVCVWQWGHFDFGVIYKDGYDREHGYHITTICKRFFTDCQVIRVVVLPPGSI